MAFGAFRRLTESGDKQKGMNDLLARLPLQVTTARRDIP